MKTAIVIGATGLVGSELTRLLLEDKRIEKVRVLVRRSTGIVHPTLEEHVVDFEQPKDWENLLRGDMLFSCLGTTIGKAGNKDAQYKIDYTYQYEMARAASQNGVIDYALISSAGASVDSKIFYSRMKGELDRDVNLLNFNHIAIIRPGLLVGPRKEFRFGERISIPFVYAISSLPGLRKYRPIEAKTVAQALINAIFYAKKAKQVYELEEVFALANVVI